MQRDARSALLSGLLRACGWQGISGLIVVGGGQLWIWSGFGRWLFGNRWCATRSAKNIAITSVRYGRFSVLPMIASVAKSGPNVSPLSIPRRLASLMRARLTRLLTVPTAQ